MNKIKIFIVAFFSFGFVGLLSAQDCAPAKKDIDLAVNNVRARLQGGGDVWWDGDAGRYIVPKVEAGFDEVSSIFAAAVWIGGFDPGGNLKLAAQDFGRSTGNFDFYPGPLNPETGLTSVDTCDLWDRFFVVTGADIDKHIAQYEEAKAAGNDYDPNLIPESVKGWPAKGNPFFFSVADFELPNTQQGLGSFHDVDGDQVYDPSQGDYPVIEIRGCEAPQYPDEMVFWVYNDAGGIHNQTDGDAIQMEVQVQAFSYATNDELNDMTFMRYKLINRAVEDIDSCYFGFWIDPDLGCHEDDYIGCDTTVQTEIINGVATTRSRDLMYVYNEDSQDGNPGTSCPGGNPTYGDEVPILGVDYFRGPLKPTVIDGIDTLVELGMSSFIYYNNSAVGNPQPGTTDPGTAIEYYRYLTGTWRDGTPVTEGGTGYGGTVPTKFVFPSTPNDDNGWSMCTASLGFGDRRTVQASGPFKLKPGAVNELIVGVPWVPNIDYPCPDISRLLFADDLAQSLFNNCFDITDGPDAPDVDFVELDREIVAVFSNDDLSNNAAEKYEEPDLIGPPGAFYNFEGYKLYQLAGPTVTTGELDDPDKAALVYQCDLSNGVAKVYNWVTTKNPSSNGGEFNYEAILKVEGAESGIQHSVKLTEDRFANNDRKLINNKKYYYVAIAYAYNNWDDFNNLTGVGQKSAYLEGRRNIKTYVVSPRQILDRNLNANYGTSPLITRVDGIGAGHITSNENTTVLPVIGGTRLLITKESEDKILSGDFDGMASQVTYESGTGPIDVKVYDPLRVKAGEFSLKFIDGSGDVTDDTYWELSSVDNPDFVVLCDTSISKLNEQLISEYGFSVTVGQTQDTGDFQEGNGYVGLSIGTDDELNAAWFRALPSGVLGSPSTYLTTFAGGFTNRLDPDQSFSGSPFVPFDLTAFRQPVTGGGLVSPGWMHPNGEQFERNLADLNNVDIVLTSDKSKWSRCVVLETSNSAYYDDLGWPTIGNKENMELRGSPSVGKDGQPDGDGEGMGWFPGYAIDVETGKRLDVFFGENSSYSKMNINDDTPFTAGTDMLYNPDPVDFQNLDNVVPGFSIANYYLGGQHMIWVSDVEYDECEYFRDQLAKSDFQKIKAMNKITWTGITVLNPDYQLKSIEDGLIPSDIKVILRVDNPFDKVTTDIGPNGGMPMYTFKFEDVDPTVLNEEETNHALDQINVVPNPYYAYSAYETSQYTNIVKITNLPAKCEINIFSIDGKFIRQYTRDEVEIAVAGNNRAIPSNQFSTNLEWDLKNSKGIPVASGVYLIHIDAGDKGERVIKWFGVARQFDPSGL